jgi:hypothetical protein
MNVPGHNLNRMLAGLEHSNEPGEKLEPPRRQERQGDQKRKKAFALVSLGELGALAVAVKVL